jgi:hypothetical protein
MQGAYFLHAYLQQFASIAYMWQMQRHQTPLDSLLDSRLQSQQVSQPPLPAYHVPPDGIGLIQGMVVAPWTKLVENVQPDIDVQINVACLFYAAQDNIMPSWRVRCVLRALQESTVRMSSNFLLTAQRASMPLLVQQYVQIVLLESTQLELQMHARHALQAATVQMRPSRLFHAKRANTAPR